MGSLAVLMKMGLFQLDGCVEDSKYHIGSPLFDRIEIQLQEAYYPGSSFIIEVQNNSPENVYIQSLTWNGQPSWEEAPASSRSLSSKGCI